MGEISNCILMVLRYYSTFIYAHLVVFHSVSASILVFSCNELLFSSFLLSHLLLKHQNSIISFYTCIINQHKLKSLVSVAKFLHNSKIRYELI